MDEDRIWLLLARRLCGDISVRELAELAELINARPELGFPIAILVSLVEADDRNVDRPPVR